jgi:hypothetical protein
MSWVRGFLRFGYEFVVGDDWRIAAGVLVVLGTGALLVATRALSHDVIAVLVALGIMSVVVVSITLGAREDSA